MKAEILKKHLDKNGIEITKSFVGYLYEAMEEYASLKVAEATLPNVKDWERVENKFIDDQNFGYNQHHSDIFDWLKQHYSTPLSASEQSPKLSDEQKEKRIQQAIKVVEQVVAMTSELAKDFPQKLSPSDDEILKCINNSGWSECEFKRENTPEDKYNFLEINTRILLEKLRTLFSQPIKP